MLQFVCCSCGLRRVVGVQHGTVSRCLPVLTPVQLPLPRRALKDEKGKMLCCCRAFVWHPWREQKFACSMNAHSRKVTPKVALPASVKTPLINPSPLFSPCGPPRLQWPKPIVSIPTRLFVENHSVGNSFHPKKEC